MKKILTAILTAALLISSAGCQAKQPQTAQNEPEPAPQALVVNVEPATENSEKHIDTSAALEQIAAGLKIKPDTTEKKKVATQNKDEGQTTTITAEQKKAQEPKENLDVQGSEPAAESKGTASTPAPKQPATEPDAYLKVTVKGTPTPPPAATPAPTPAPRRSRQHPLLHLPSLPRNPSSRNLPSTSATGSATPKAVPRAWACNWRVARWTAGITLSEPDPTAPAWRGTSTAD